jgi:hypothetical protein
LFILCGESLLKVTQGTSKLTFTPS